MSQSYYTARFERTVNQLRHDFWRSKNGQQYVGTTVMMPIAEYMTGYDWRETVDLDAARRNSLTAAVRALPGQMLHESYWHCFRRLMDSNGRFTQDMLAQFFPRTSGDPRV